MAFHLDCECGRHASVSTSQAGSEVLCPCGRLLGAPSLSELKAGVTQPTRIFQAAEQPPPASTGSLPAESQPRPHGACMFCGGSTERGAILGDRYQLKWLPDDKSLLLGIWATGGEPIGEATLFSRPKVEGRRCTACRKIIIDY